MLLNPSLRPSYIVLKRPAYSDSFSAMNTGMNLLNM
jgi:hypothetical protein